MASEMIGVAQETEGRRAAGERPPTHFVRVLPGDVTVEVAEGETLMFAALRAGFRWPSVCGGEAVCTTCFVLIRKGLDAVVGPDDSEEDALELVRLRFSQDPESVRLACQLKVTGDGVELFRPGVRPIT